MREKPIKYIIGRNFLRAELSGLNNSAFEIIVPLLTLFYERDKGREKGRVKGRKRGEEEGAYLFFV